MRGGHAALRSLTLGLYLLQPAARLWGRLAYGLVPWRRRPARSLRWPIPYRLQAWSESWRDPEDRIRQLERSLVEHGARVARGDAFARWDLEVSCGLLGAYRTRLALEEHGQGRQLLRMRAWPRWPLLGSVIALILGGGSWAALADGASWAGIAMVVAVAAVLLRLVLDLAAAAGACSDAFRHAASDDAPTTPTIKQALSHVADR